RTAVARARLLGLLRYAPPCPFRSGPGDQCRRECREGGIPARRPVVRRVRPDAHPRAPEGGSRPVLLFGPTGDAAHMGGASPAFLHGRPGDGIQGIRLPLPNNILRPLRRAVSVAVLASAELRLRPHPAGERPGSVYPVPHLLPTTLLRPERELHGSISLLWSPEAPLVPRRKLLRHVPSLRRDAKEGRGDGQLCVAHISSPPRRRAARLAVLAAVRAGAQRPHYPDQWLQRRHHYRRTRQLLCAVAVV